MAHQRIAELEAQMHLLQGNVQDLETALAAAQAQATTLQVMPLLLWHLTLVDECTDINMHEFS